MVSSYNGVITMRVSSTYFIVFCVRTFKPLNEFVIQMFVFYESHFARGDYMTELFPPPPTGC